MESQHESYHPRAVEPEFKPPDKFPVKGITFKKKLLSIIIVLVVILFGVIGYMWVIHEPTDSLVVNDQAKTLCESTGGEYDCVCPEGAKCDCLECECPAYTSWHSNYGCHDSEQRKLCESTGGEFIVWPLCDYLSECQSGGSCECPSGDAWYQYTGCQEDVTYHLRDACEATGGIYTPCPPCPDDADCARCNTCECPEGHESSAQGCQPIVYDEKELCESTEGTYEPCECPEGVECDSCPASCSCPEGSIFGPNGCQDSSIIQIDIEHRVCEADEDCVTTPNDCVSCDCTAVNSKYQSQYYNQFSEQCVGFGIGNVLCEQCLDDYAICVAGTCQYREGDSECVTDNDCWLSPCDGCYSTQHLPSQPPRECNEYPADEYSCSCVASKCVLRP